ncbi:FHA domain-containing protein [Bordetella tumbae]|uniref:FHA domain-containing protein n=1 Tax=Bordetella tumbae TaxID=1649139 RepID=UPI0039F0E037
MKLTVQQRPEDSGFITPWSAVFKAPGGTLGRSADNHLVLPDPTHGICRIQAAVRISNDACYLVNLSSMSSVSINGRAIHRDQEVPLSLGDELVIGSYKLRAEDPLAPTVENTAASADGFTTLNAGQTPLSAEPDPLLESPLLDLAAIAPTPTPPRENPTPISLTTSAPPSPPSVSSAPVALATASVAMTAAAEAAAPLTAAQPEPDTTAQSDNAPSSHIEDTAAVAEAHTTTTTAADTTATAPLNEDIPQPADEAIAPSPPTTHFAEPAATDAVTDTAAVSSPPVAEERLFDEPFANTSAADTSSTDVFSDLFGPGTLPVGSVPDVSAHPFDMESAQNRNPEDPLRHLPRGDANVSGPLRDPLDLLDSHEGDDVHNVFSDQTPSTLPSDDPLAPHRLDPVSEALRNTQDHDNQGWAARDHLREYGGYLRPARVQQPSPASDDNTGQKTDTPRRK